MKLRGSTLVISCAFVLAITACGDDDDDDIPTGTLQQSWTIAGAKNPDSCTRYNAAQMRLVAIGPGAVVQATQFTPCNAFQTTLTLPANTYTAAATFLDANGVAVSQTLNVSAFFIAEDLTTIQNVDFTPINFLLQ
jgi:hypothetical protein